MQDLVAMEMNNFKETQICKGSQRKANDRVENSKYYERSEKSRRRKSTRINDYGKTNEIANVLVEFYHEGVD